MRFSTTTLGSPATTPTLTVQPLGGTNWNPTNAATGVSMQFAFETIINQLNSSHIYGASIVGTAAAANKAVAELNNPAASGKTLWVYVLDFFVPVAMAVNLFEDGTTLTPVGTGFNLTLGGVGGVAKVGGGNQLATTGSLIYTSPTLAINSTFPIPQPWLVAIPAGHNLQLQGQTVNQAFTCNVRWVEL